MTSPQVTDVGAPTARAYVPAWLQRESIRDPGCLREPGGRKLRGAMMLADVSGFTGLTERLRARGSEGAEILWRQIDGYFGRMMEIITAHGGEVLRFPGDAAIVLFDASQISGSALEAAAACGIALQANLGRYPTEDGEILRMRVAISVGEMQAAWLGGLLDRWEAVVIGDPLFDLGEALHAAEIGDVIVADAAAALLPVSLRRQPLGGGHQRLLGNEGPPFHLQLAQTPAGEVADGPLRPFVPQAVLARIDAGHARWLAELRNLNVLMAKVQGVREKGDPLGPATVEQLQVALSTLQEAVYHYGGSVNEFIQDDKGVVFVAAWGLPGRSHEDDSVRAVRAALEARRVLEERGMILSVGVAQGKVFCGQRGGMGRLEYSVLGSPVNLAARLSAQTHGGVLCSPEVYRSAGSRVRFTRGPELKLKGMDTPIQSWLPTPVGREVARNIRPVYGREEELGQLDHLLARIEDGHSGTVIIEGVPGVGKSSLVRALGSIAEERGLRVLHGAGDSIDHQEAYHAFRLVFEEVMGLNPGLAPLARHQQAQAWLAGDAGVGELAPLFGPLLRIALRDNSRTVEMVGQSRAETALEAYVGVLAALDRPVVIIDDIQWLDTASWQLLRAARRTLPAALFVLTTRPSQAYPSEAYDALRAEEGVVHIPLGPLDEAGTERLLRHRLSVASIDPPLLDLVHGRSEGLPFYAEELALALRDQELLEVESGVCRLGSAAGAKESVLPATLEGVITSRIDRLSANQQLALKTASVIGRTFLVECLHDIFPIDTDPHQLERELEQLIGSDLIEIGATEPAVAYRFTHVITQEVAYELLLYEQRRGLHRAVAEWLEAGNAGDPVAFYSRMAWHWRRTGDKARAIQALEAAGEQAFGTFAEQEAVEYLSAALALVEESGATLETRRLARWQRVLGEARMRLGQLEGALDHLVKANALLGFPVPTSDLAVGLRLMVEVFRQFLRHMGWSRPRQIADGTAHLDAAHAHLELSLMAYFLRKIPLVLYGGGRGLNLAQDAGASPDLARALAQWAVIMSGLPLHKAAESYSLDALEIAGRFEDRYSLGNAQHYRGIIDLTMGRFAAAIEILELARENYDRVGNGRRVQEATNSIIYAAMPLGRYDFAILNVERLAQIARTRTDAQALFWVKINEVELAWRRGEGAQILQEVDESGSQDEIFVARLRGLRVLLLLEQGDLPGATTAVAPLLKLGRPTSFIESLAFFGLFRHALAVARADPKARRRARKRAGQVVGFGKIFPMGQPLGALALAEVAELEGDVTRTRAACEACLESARALACPWEELQALGILSRVSQGAEASGHLQAAAEIAGRLGLRTSPFLKV